MDWSQRQTRHTALRLRYQASRRKECIEIPERVGDIQEELAEPQGLEYPCKATPSLRVIPQPPQLRPTYVLYSRTTEPRSPCHELYEHCRYLTRWLDAILESERSYARR
jgi:hypothetical protein